MSKFWAMFELLLGGINYYIHYRLHAFEISRQISLIYRCTLDESG